MYPVDSFRAVSVAKHSVPGAHNKYTCEYTQVNYQNEFIFVAFSSINLIQNNVLVFALAQVSDPMDVDFVGKHLQMAVLYANTNASTPVMKLR